MLEGELTPVDWFGTCISTQGGALDPLTEEGRSALAVSVPSWEVLERTLAGLRNLTLPGDVDAAPDG